LPSQPRYESVEAVLINGEAADAPAMCGNPHVCPAYWFAVLIEH
jgi:hypothetical protein